MTVFVHTRPMKRHPNGIAPTVAHGNKGNKGGAVAQAWQYVWDRLSTTEYVDAVGLAIEAGKIFTIQPESVRAHMYAMVREGVLEAQNTYVQTSVTRNGKTFPARRKRAFYRIAERTPQEVA